MIQAVILESVGIDNQYEPNERYLQFFFNSMLLFGLNIYWNINVYILND